MKKLSVKIILLIIFCHMAFIPYVALACCGCMPIDCEAAKEMIDELHDTGSIDDGFKGIFDNTKQEFDEDLAAFEKWVKSIFFRQEIVYALRKFTTQMNAVTMQQTQIIGTFLDAKSQLETQRLFQELQAEAHRDYVPSDDFCWFGTNTKSMADSVVKSKIHAFGLSQKALDRQLGNINTKGADGVEVDLKARWERFKQERCDTYDNNATIIRSNTGLKLACGNGVKSGEYFRVNRDVDYTRMVDLPRTIDFDFTDGKADQDDDRDIVALQENLYGHRVLSRGLDATKLKSPAAQNLYLALRSIAAKRSVAEFTYSSIVGLKSAGTLEEYRQGVLSSGFPITPAAEDSVRQYLAAIVRELYPYDKDYLNCWVDLDGKQLCDMDIYELIGQNPSYYSQLEIMGKKMYQNPDFYVKLYDTPANVARKGVAMRAIELMIDREMYESQLRREMAVSVLLSSKLRATERRVNEALTKATSRK